LISIHDLNTTSHSLHQISTSRISVSVIFRFHVCKRTTSDAQILSPLPRNLLMPRRLKKGVGCEICCSRDRGVLRVWLLLGVRVHQLLYNRKTEPGTSIERPFAISRRLKVRDEEAWLLGATSFRTPLQTHLITPRYAKHNSSSTEPLHGIPHINICIIPFT